jgi:hypothetical protein
LNDAGVPTRARREMVVTAVMRMLERLDLFREEEAAA